MRPEEETFGEASQMLRVILQNRKKQEKDYQEQQQDQAKENNNSVKTFDDTAASPSSASDFGVVSDNQDIVNSLRSSKPNLVGDSDGQSESLKNLSEDESDFDTAYGAPNCENDVQKENDLEPDDITSSASSQYLTDSKEAKRARVENILTTMRQCPQPGYGALTQSSYNEMKKQKRKQPQPQQHDARSLQPQQYRNMDCVVIQEHIRNIQEQLHAVKRSVNQISKCESEDGDNDTKPNSEHDDVENDETVDHSLHENTADESMEEMDSGTPTDSRLSPSLQDRAESGRSTSPCLSCRPQLQDPENKKHMPRSMHVHEPIFSNHSQLKLDIIQAVKRAVDSAVITVLNKHANPLNEQHKLELQTQQQEEQSSPSELQKPQEPVQQLLNIPRPKQEREALKETVSNSQTEKAADLITPYPHNLSMLDRLGHSRSMHEKLSAFESLHSNESSEVLKPHTSSAIPFPPHYPYSYMHSALLPPMLPIEPEQTEALPLVVSNMPKKKRTKVTDTRLSPRNKPGLLPDSPGITIPNMAGESGDRHPLLPSPFPHPYLPPVLPTSVAITNPSLHHSELFGMRFHENMFDNHATPPPVRERSTPKSSTQDNVQNMLKSDVFDTSASDSPMDGQGSLKLRKAKLMFFYTRYPNSGILKIYFPDVSFNKNNTAQLVKWFSNFREFYYIQMEKFARQSVTDGVAHSEELTVGRDSELFRQLNLHYNRNNQIEAPESFRIVAEATLKEFFHAIHGKKDLDSSWKKTIYKVIARMDEPIPEFFKSPNWIEHLGEI